MAARTALTVSMKRFVRTKSLDSHVLLEPSVLYTYCMAQVGSTQYNSRNEKDGRRKEDTVY